MKRNLIAAAVLLFFCMTAAGCGNDKTAYFEMPENAEAGLILDTDTQAASQQFSGNAGNGGEASSKQDTGNAGNGSEASSKQDTGNAGGGSEASSQQDTANSEKRNDALAEQSSEGMENGSGAVTNQGSEASAEQDICYVYVCGAVEKPGVYELEAGARIYEAVEAAGGLTEEADFSSVNQAEKVSDGQMVKILTKEEAEALGETSVSGGTSPSGNEAAAGSGDAGTEQDGRININLASAEELMTLPGIGRAKADSMISYRESNGGFSSIEEIMQVEGIKEGVFNRVKDSIKVK